MQNKTLSLLLACTFFANLFAPGVAAAQERVGRTELNITGYPEGVEYDKKRDLDFVHTSQKGFFGFAADKKDVDQAQLRLFLTTAPDDVFLYFLSTQKIPTSGKEFYASDDAPFVWVRSMPTANYRAALKRLNQMQEQGALFVEDYVNLISSPSDEIAAFGMAGLSELLVYANSLKETSFLTQLHAQFPKLVANVQARMKKLNGYEQREKDTLWGASHVLLAQLHKSYLLSGQKSPLGQPALQALFSDMSAKLREGWTNKERLHGPSASRAKLVESMTLAQTTYLGVDGFARVVNYLESKNTDLVGRPASKINTDYATLLSSAFVAMQQFYANNPSQLQADKAKLKTLMIKYANPGHSSALRMWAIIQLLTLYEPGNIVTGKAPEFLTQQEANQVADMIKNTFYCRMDGFAGDRNPFGLNSRELAEMQDMFATLYNKIRQDPQSYVMPVDKSGRAATPPCYVKPVNSINPRLQADEMVWDALGFALAWVAFDGIFYVGAKGIQGGKSIVKLGAQSLKMSSGTRTQFLKESIANSLNGARMAKRLDRVGVQINKTTVTKSGQQVTEPLFGGALPRTGDQIIGIQASQRFPGGRLKVTETANVAQFKNTGDVLEHFVEKVSIGSKADYRSIIAAEDVLHAGLTRIGPKAAVYQKTLPANLAKSVDGYAPGSIVANALRAPVDEMVALYIKRPVYLAGFFALPGFFSQARIQQNEANEKLEKEFRVDQQLAEQERDNELMFGPWYAAAQTQNAGAPQPAVVSEPKQKKASYADQLAEVSKKSPAEWIDSFFAWGVGNLLQVPGKTMRGEYFPVTQAGDAERRAILQNNPYVRIYQQKLEEKQKNQLQQPYPALQTADEDALGPDYAGQAGVQPATQDSYLTPEEEKWLKENGY